MIGDDTTLVHGNVDDGNALPRKGSRGRAVVRRQADDYR